MGNPIRNILTIYGAPDEADRFTGRFLRGGLEAMMPTPPNTHLNRNHAETWGASLIGSDIELLTSDSIGVVEVAYGGTRPDLTLQFNWLKQNNTFTIAEHHNQLMSLNLPGFLGQHLTPVAAFVFCTKTALPYKWIDYVINAEYDNGLFLHVKSYDLLRYDLRHSYSATESKYIVSGHCAMFAQMPDGDYDDGPALPAVDAERNAIKAS